MKRVKRFPVLMWPLILAMLLGRPPEASAQSGGGTPPGGQAPGAEALSAERFDFAFDAIPLIEVIRDLQRVYSDRTKADLNLVIPMAMRRFAENELVSIHLRKVTVTEFLELLALASERPVPARTPSIDPSIGAVMVMDPGPTKSTAGYRFAPVHVGPNSTTAWVLESDLPPEVLAGTGSIPAAPQAVSESRYFSLDPFLEKYSVEDVVTAVRAGWDMQALRPQPQLKFHEATRLLIAVGAPGALQSIEMVLVELRATLDRPLREAQSGRGEAKVR